MFLIESLARPHQEHKTTRCSSDGDAAQCAVPFSGGTGGADGAGGDGDGSSGGGALSRDRPPQQ